MFAIICRKFIACIGRNREKDIRFPRMWKSGAYVKGGLVRPANPAHTAQLNQEYKTVADQPLSKNSFDTIDQTATKHHHNWDMGTGSLSRLLWRRRHNCNIGVTTYKKTSDCRAASVANDGAVY